jgi:hypothetical protein
MIMGRVGIGELEDLVAGLGHSTRTARRVVRAVLNKWKSALSRGAAVEVPGGIIRVRTVTHTSARIVRLRKGNATGLSRTFRVLRGKRRVIRFLHTVEFFREAEDQPFEQYYVPRRANGLIDRRSEWRRERQRKEQIERRHRYLFGPD